MVSTENDVSTQDVMYKSEIQEEPELSLVTNNDMKLVDFIPIYIPTIEKGIIDQKHHKKRFLDFLKAHPTNDWFLKSGFVRRFPLYRRNGRSSDNSMPSDPGQEPGRRRFRVPFIRKINWKALLNYFKKWIRKPHNIALFIWLVFVAAGLLLMGLLMLGILNGAIRSSDRRKKWEEIDNQILNALFQIMCLYEHPRIFHHTVLLLRWRQNDQVEARSAYCKNGTPRPHDRAHMIFVVTLLHVTCFAQYAYCGLFWGYSRETRPDWAENLCIGIGIGAPVIAALYTFFGPLAKKVETPTDQESQAHASEVAEPEEGKMQLYHRKVIVTTPEWIGGLFDCWDDATVAISSFFCTFCVFGWNMERIGFGNMYVHIVTFLLLCVAPLWVFYVAALNINNNTIRLIVAISGAVLCIFGLLYGGYWRSKMRQKFKLPGNPFCCGYPLVTDCVQWFFCWCCSLAQEVRTANFYDIEDDGFYRKVTDEEGHTVLVPLPREGNLSFSDTARSYSCPPKIGPIDDAADSKEGSRGYSPLESPTVFGRSSTFSKVHAMTPPLPPLIQMEDEHPMKE